MNFNEAKATLKKLEKFIIDLQLYSWDEILENLPDGNGLKDEIEELLDCSSDAINNLKEFFE